MRCGLKGISRFWLFSVAFKWRQVRRTGLRSQAQLVYDLVLQIKIHTRMGNGNGRVLRESNQWVCGFRELEIRYSMALEGI